MQQVSSSSETMCLTAAYRLLLCRDVHSCVCSQNQLAGSCSCRQLCRRITATCMLCFLPVPPAGHPLGKAMRASLITPLMAASAAATGAAKAAGGQTAAGAATAPEPPGAAAAAGGGGTSDSTTYSRACVQLLLAVCGEASSSSLPQASSSTVQSSELAQQWECGKVADALGLVCRLQPHVLLACRQGGEDTTHARLHLLYHISCHMPHAWEGIVAAC